MRRWWLGLLASAALCAQTMPPGEPPQAMALARQAYERARAGDFPAAEAALQQAMKLAPANALYRSALGGLYQNQGKMEAAIGAFAEAVRLDPNNATLRGRLETLSLEWGAVLAKEKRFRAGLTLARETAKRFPQSAPAHLMLGLFETRNQQNVSAVSAYQRALQLDPDSADASAGLGVAQTSAGMITDAERTFITGMKRFPKDALHRQAYGVLLVKIAEERQEPLDRAVSMFRAALELDATLAESHYQLGRIALEQGDTVAARKSFETAAALGLDDSRLHYAWARALRRAGDAAAAAQHLQLFEERKRQESVTP